MLLCHFGMGFILVRGLHHLRVFDFDHVLLLASLRAAVARPVIMPLMQVSKTNMDTTWHNIRHCTCFNISRTNIHQLPSSFEIMGSSWAHARRATSFHGTQGKRRLPQRTAAINALTRRAADFPSNASCCLSLVLSAATAFMHQMYAAHAFQNIYEIRLINACNITNARMKAIATRTLIGARVWERVPAWSLTVLQQRGTHVQSFVDTRFKWLPTGFINRGCKTQRREGLCYPKSLAWRRELFGHSFMYNCLGSHIQYIFRVKCLWSSLSVTSALTVRGGFHKSITDFMDFYVLFE